MDALESKLHAMQKNMKEAQKDYKPGGAGVPEPVPEDDYSLVFKPTMTTSKEKGKLMVSWVFIVADGTYKGRKLYENTVLEGNESGSVNHAGSCVCRNFVEAAGEEWPEDDLKALKAVIEKINADEPQVDCKVTQVTSNGKINNRIFPHLDSVSSPAATPDTSSDSRPLVDFCTKYGISELTVDDTDETIVASLIASGMQWKEDELDTEEIEMLKANGLEGIIEVEQQKPEAKKLSRPLPKKGKK